MKKIFTILMVFAIMYGICTLNASASCPFGHGDSFLTMSCSQMISDANIVSCPWTGGHFGGDSYHGQNCQILQFWRYTTESCSLCDYVGSSGSHFCYADHTQATPSMHVDRCPY